MCVFPPFLCPIELIRYNFHVSKQELLSNEFQMINVLPKTNVAPENWPSEKESSLPLTNFQGRAVSYQGGNVLLHLGCPVFYTSFPRSVRSYRCPVALRHIFSTLHSECYVKKVCGQDYGVQDFQQICTFGDQVNLCCHNLRAFFGWVFFWPLFF